MTRRALCPRRAPRVKSDSKQAMQLVVRYGDKIWDKFPEPDSAQGE